MLTVRRVRLAALSLTPFYAAVVAVACGGAETPPAAPPARATARKAVAYA